MTLAILIPAALIGIGATWWTSAQYLKAWESGTASPPPPSTSRRTSSGWSGREVS